MPFTPTSDLPPNPAVRIFFSGVMILRPTADGKTCEVWVNRRAAGHHLTIEVREKKAGSPDLIKMRHVGPLSFGLPPPGFPNDPRIHGMIISVNTAPKGVKGYNGTIPSTEGERLADAINLQTPQFHNGGAGEVERLGGRPSILINDAVFYTAEKTDPTVTINLKRAATPTTRLLPFAAVIGANIYLDAGNQVVVSWRPQGVVEELKLEKPPAGTSYEIYIINDPLYEGDDSKLAAHDEFAEYYTILPQIKTDDRFQLEVILPGPGPFLHRGSTKTPCMPIVLEP